MCVSPRSPPVHRRAMSLSLVRLDSGDENNRGEPHEILVICFINFVYPWFARKKRQIPNDISKYFIHWSIYDLFYSSPRKKKIVCKEFVSSFFPVNFREGQFFMTYIMTLAVSKAAISRYASNIVNDLVWDSDLRVCKCQYPRHKNRRPKVKREVNLKMAEEIKAGGESSWWQGDCKPNRTRTVIAILNFWRNIPN